jgi:hypothetical protein
MIRSDKKLQSLALLLEKKESLLLANAVDMLREEQPFEGAVALLAGLYDRTSDKPVRHSIEGFLNDLKDPSAREEVINEILKPGKPETIAMLVASCWQSGLDYSSFTPIFARLFLRSDYAVAVECLTVIGESIPEMNSDQKSELLDILKEPGNESEPDKQHLTDELVRIIRM